MRYLFVPTLLCILVAAGWPGHFTLNEPLLAPYSLANVEYGSLDLGDYDADGDLDLLLSGIKGRRPFTRVYRLDDSVFTIPRGEAEDRHIFKTFRDVNAILPQVWQGSARWGDFDGDGDLDIMLSGLAIVQEEVDTDVVEIFTDVYENRSNIFVKASHIVLPDVFNGPLLWGDYDGDGDLDVLVGGATRQNIPYEPITRLFRNDGGSFVGVDSNLPGLMFGDAAWADIDRDGDLDLALLGQTNGAPTTGIWRNDGDGAFVELNVDVPDLAYGSVAWGDYDDDGDPDLVLTGARFDPELYRGETIVLRNEGEEQFTDISAGLTDVMLGSAEWTDFDRDGDLDLIVIGRVSATGRESGWIYLNEGADRFIPDIRLAGLVFSGMAVGDYNGDGDPDLVVSGRNADGRPVTSFYINQSIKEPLPLDLFPR